MTSTRARLPLPFGAGLDRTTGPMAVSGTAQEDLRNVYLSDGFAWLRKGSLTAAECIDPTDDLPMTTVIAGGPFKAQGTGILVAWREESGDVRIFRVTRAGETPQHIAKWFTLADGAQTPPLCWMAEVAGQMFFAHDEVALSLRAPTVGYDPAAGALAPITAEWAHEDGIAFRGITAHLGAYLCGWGYGTSSEARSDLVRMSMPGDPTTFQLRHYESIGQRADQVLACFSTGHTLLCFKAEELWNHFGSDRSNFGKRQLDPLVGLLSPHLGVVVDADVEGAAGTVYVWTPLGPRASNGGVPVDLEFPLGIYFPEPADLALLGDAKRAFAAYLPARRQVRFHFDERYYAFDVVSKQWSYGEMGYAPACGFILPGIQAEDGAQPGLAAALAIASDVVGAAFSRDVTLRWTNGSMVGDEELELWMKIAAGAWTLMATVPVEADDTQDHLFSGLAANTSHQFQIRASRGGEYRDAYPGVDPTAWPATSKLTYVTSSAAPVLVLTNANDHIHLAWTNTDLTAASRVYKKLDAGAYVLLASPVAGVDHYDDSFDVGDEVGKTATYYVDQVGGTVSNAEATVLAVPTMQDLAQVAPTDRWYQYAIDWTDNNLSDVVTRIEDNYQAGLGYQARIVTAAGATDHTQALEKNSAMDPNGNQPIVASVRARHEVTRAAVTYVSAWVVLVVNAEVAPDETAH